MSCKMRTASFICLLIIISLLCGCESLRAFKMPTLGAPQIDEVGMTAADEEKANLLKKIDRKFDDSDAHFNLGRMYQSDGMWTQAEYEYNTALGFDPAHRPSQASMVKVLLESDNLSRAEIYSDIYINQVSNSAAESLRLGLAFQRQALDEYALTCYRQALGLAPNSAKVNRQIGYYYLSRNERDVAKSYLKRSFDLNRNQADVAGELGRLGVAVRIPQKMDTSAKKLDKIIDRSDMEMTQ